MIRMLLRPALVAALLTGAGIVHATPAPAPTTPVDVAPVHDPTWSAADARRFPGCSSTKVLGDVVVVGTDGRARRMTFDHAWRLTHDSSPYTGGWVVGWCRTEP